MRKIDSASFNKRLMAEITELGSMLDKINAENVKYFDSDLIRTATSYAGLLKNSLWSSNSNFNSIEFSKIKQMINYIRTSKNILVADREIKEISNTDNFAGMIQATGVNVYRVPDNNDGRLSFVYPRILVEEQDENDNITKRYLNADEIFNGGMTYITDDYYVWKMPEYGTTTARLEIVKNKHEISIHYDLNLGEQRYYDYGAEGVPYETGTEASQVVAIYLDTLYILWRKK